MNSGRKLGEYFSPDIFKAGFQRVFEPFPRSKGFQSVSQGFPKCFKRVSKEFQSVSKGFPKGFQRVSKGFQRVSKGFPKGFKPSQTRFPMGFRATSNPLENAFVDKTCFRMEGHI